MQGCYVGDINQEVRRRLLIMSLSQIPHSCSVHCSNEAIHYIKSFLVLNGRSKANLYPMFVASSPIRDSEAKYGASRVAPRVQVDFDGGGVRVHMLFWLRCLGTCNQKYFTHSAKSAVTFLRWDLNTQCSQAKRMSAIKELGMKFP